MSGFRCLEAIFISASFLALRLPVCTEKKRTSENLFLGYRVHFCEVEFISAKQAFMPQINVQSILFSQCINLF